MLLGAVVLHRASDQGFAEVHTEATLGLLTGRKRAYDYFHLERVLTTIAKAGGADSLTTALGKWSTSLWSSPSPCFYIDGHRKLVYADKLIPRGLIGNIGNVLGARALVLLHGGQGHPLLAPGEDAHRVKPSWASHTLLLRFLIEVEAFNTRGKTQKKGKQ